jgi:hypothetical protein
VKERAHLVNIFWLRAWSVRFLWVIRERVSHAGGRRGPRGKSVRGAHRAFEMMRFYAFTFRDLSTRMGAERWSRDRHGRDGWRFKKINEQPIRQTNFRNNNKNGFPGGVFGVNPSFLFMNIFFSIIFSPPISFSCMYNNNNNNNNNNNIPSLEFRGVFPPARVQYPLSVHML